ncbi:hypothetical protein GCM10025881_05520 [Pseudolysinimonas kribbensis]|uniref:SDR family NAD(P)-dependent oxidoreductase n=1 Tax=Pseudolysinimonas kribbensis TaxID=433641 RepID=A0ABQ6JZR0_9MICO|nr:hypothetical protein GCM10025881_05520 [Pseudolysinimonas kribbensis]
MPRSVVVTGASSGIGEATSRLLAAHGWEVIGVARRADRLAALADEIGLRPVVADVTDPAGVDAVRAAVGGRLDALVNNAGARSASTRSRTRTSTTGGRCTSPTCSEPSG